MTAAVVNGSAATAAEVDSVAALAATPLAILVPAMLVAIGLLFVVFFWRLARKANRRVTYWRGVAAIWQRNRRRGLH